MPTRYNRGIYCRSYCLLNMFRAPLCPSSGAQEYYIVVAACGISCCGFQVAGLVWSWGLCVRFAGCWFKPASCQPDTLLRRSIVEIKIIFENISVVNFKTNFVHRYIFKFNLIISQSIGDLCGTLLCSKSNYWS